MSALSLKDWAKYQASGNSDYEPWLEVLRQYDPEAKYIENINVEGQRGIGNLQYNPDKLPKSKYGPLGTFTPAPHARMKNPSLYYEDPYYGKITPNTNIRDSKGSWIDIVGPLVVGGAAGLGALSGGGSFLGGMGAAGKAQSIPKLAQSVGSGQGFNPVSMLGLATNFLPPSVAPFVKAGLAGYGAYNSFDQGNTVGGLSNLYKLGRSFNITGGP